MFNLNQAIGDWRFSLGQQPSFLDSDLDEFEEHLREEIEVLKESRLSDKEAFLVSSMRIGKPEELSTEFAIADPGRLHHRQLIWMLSGALALFLLLMGTQIIADYSTGALIRVFDPSKTNFSIEGLGWFRGVFRIALFLLGGVWILRFFRNDRMANKLQKTKGRTIIFGSFLILILRAISFLSPSYMYAYSGIERSDISQIASIGAYIQMGAMVIFPVLMLVGLRRLVRV